jgi:hypothetical protein
VCVCVYEYYSVTKKNEILSFTDKWIELENIMLSKPGFKRQSSHVFPHMWKIDPNTNTNLIIHTHTHTHMHIWHVCKSGMVRGDEGEKEEMNDKRVNNIEI